MGGSSVHFKDVTRITRIEDNVKIIIALLTSILQGIDAICATKPFPSKRTGRITTKTPTMEMT
jgi:hypothetical protein